MLCDVSPTSRPTLSHSSARWGGANSSRNVQISRRVVMRASIMSRIGVAAILAVVGGGGGGMLLADEPASSAFQPIERRLPPQGIELPADVQSNLRHSLDALQERLSQRADDPRISDVSIFTK